MRIDQDISAVCAAFMITLKDDRIATVRLAFGGMAAIPARARVTEAALLNQAWNQATINTAITALEEDFKPLSGMHASDLYRLRGAGNLLQRFYLEHSGTTPLLRTHQKLSSLSFSTDTTP
jgi:xanthine dehydrogenase small subunit